MGPESRQGIYIYICFGSIRSDQTVGSLIKCRQIVVPFLVCDTCTHACRKAAEEANAEESSSSEKEQDGKGEDEKESEMEKEKKPKDGEDPSSSSSSDSESEKPKSKPVSGKGGKNETEKSGPGSADGDEHQDTGEWEEEEPEKPWPISELDFKKYCLHSDNVHDLENVDFAKDRGLSSCVRTHIFNSYYGHWF